VSVGLSAGDLFEWYGAQLHRLIGKMVEQEATNFRSAAVETERKLVEGVVELPGTDCPVVNPQPPPIEKSGHAVNAGHDDMGRVAAGGNVLRQVFEADVRESVVGLPAVGSDRRSRAYRRLDERNEAFGRYVSDTGHADAAGAPPPEFGGNSDNRFLVCFSTCSAYLTADDVCFINLDITLQKVSAWLNHGAAKLMELRPGRLGRQPLIEFPERTWVVGLADWMGYFLSHPNILALRERSGHPISKKKYDRAWLLCPKL
jgi:hypothetical protein